MNNQRLFISMYHYVRDLKHSKYPEIKGMDIDLFYKQMQYFKDNFNVVTMEEVIAAETENKALPDNALLLTFDDGYIDNYEYAFPVLKEFGFQGSFFIPGKTFTEHKLLDVNKIHHILACADINDLVKDLKKMIDLYHDEYDYPSCDELWRQYAVESRFDPKEVIFVKRILQAVLPEQLRSRISSDLFSKYVGISETQLAKELYMTTDQIRQLKDGGMFIGLHGYDHYWLGKLPEEKMKQDIMKALDILGEFIDRDKWVMNYPYGSYNEEVLKFVKENGACLGFTTDVRLAVIGKDDPLLLPRFDCNDFPPKSEKFRDFI